MCTKILPRQVLTLNMKNPSLQGFVVYDLEAVLMDLYITFFLFSFFLAFGGKSAQIDLSWPLGELLVQNLVIRGGFGWS